MSEYNDVLDAGRTEGLIIGLIIGVIIGIFIGWGIWG